MRFSLTMERAFVAIAPAGLQAVNDATDHRQPSLGTVRPDLQSRVPSVCAVPGASFLPGHAQDPPQTEIAPWCIASSADGQLLAAGVAGGGICPWQSTPTPSLSITPAGTNFSDFLDCAVDETCYLQVMNWWPSVRAC